jgi:hypothetical protein
MTALPALEQADRLRREPRAGGQILLRNADRGTMAPQQITELYLRSGLYPSQISLLGRVPFSGVP